MIGKAIYNILSNDATVSGYVGTKIFPNMAVEEVAMPYIVYSKTDLEPHDTKDGASELDTESYDIEIWHNNPETLHTLATAVRDALDRYSGTVESLNIQSIKFVDENTGYTDNNRLYLTMQSYDIRLVK